MYLISFSGKTLEPRLESSTIDKIILKLCANYLLGFVQVESGLNSVWYSQYVFIFYNLLRRKVLQDCAIDSNGLYCFIITSWWPLYSIRSGQSHS